MVLSGVICHEGEQPHCGHCMSGVRVDSTWVSISDTRILRQQKVQYSARDISDPHILICKKRSNFLAAPPISLNDNPGVSSTSEVIIETAETMIQQSVLEKLEKQNAKLAIDQEKEETNSNKFKSPVKRNSEFTNCSPREIDKLVMMKKSSLKRR